MPRAFLASLLAPALIVAGCSSSGGASTASTPASSGASAGSAQATALADTMRTGMARLTSAHLSVDAGALGGRSTGDVTYAGGRATASHIDLDLDGRTEIITVGDTSYAKLPAGRSLGKPWVVVSTKSTNEFVRALASQVTLSNAVSSLPAIAEVVATASSVKDEGSSGSGHRYALQVAADKVSDPTLGPMLRDLGEKVVPVDLTLDKQGRPVLVKITVDLGGESFPITITVSRFDSPLHISAPPRNEVATG